MSARSAKSELSAATKVAGTEDVDAAAKVVAVTDGAATAELSPVAHAIIDAVERLASEVGAFAKGELSLSSLSDLIDEMVRAAQVIVPERGQGALKHVEVVAAFEYLDRKYGIIDKIDAAVPLPFYLEPLDGPVFKLVIDVMIKSTVTFANKHGW